MKEDIEKDLFVYKLPAFAQMYALIGRLSEREFITFMQLARGRRIIDISKELVLSFKTVTTYRHRIVKKTGLATNVAMSQYAVFMKLITPTFDN